MNAVFGSSLPGISGAGGMNVTGGNGRQDSVPPCPSTAAGKALALLSRIGITLDLEDVATMGRAGKAIVLSRDDATGVHFAHRHFNSLPMWNTVSPTRIKDNEVNWMEATVGA